MMRIMAAERSPEVTIDGAHVAGFTAKPPRVFGIGPLFPDIHPPGAQVRFVSIAGKKPEQLFRDPTERHAFRRHQGKSFAQIETRLKSEMRDRADARAVLMRRRSEEHTSELQSRFGISYA